MYHGHIPYPMDFHLNAAWYRYDSTSISGHMQTNCSLIPSIEATNTMVQLVSFQAIYLGIALLHDIHSTTAQNIAIIRKALKEDKGESSIDDGYSKKSCANEIEDMQHEIYKDKDCRAGQ